MKKYLLLGTAAGISGWALYCDSRIEYLNNQGYKPFLIAMDGNPDNITLGNIKKSKYLIYDLFQINPYSYSNKYLKDVLVVIRKLIGYEDSDEIFVESTSIRLALWGEFIAESLRGTHFAYILQSHTENTPKFTQMFLHKKYDQSLIAGMAPNTVREMLTLYTDKEKIEDRDIDASWRGPLSEGNEFDKQIAEMRDGKSKIIGYFGNLAKPHFIPLCEYIKGYCEKHSNDSFIFLVIGSSQNQIPERKLEEINNNTNNLKTINIKALYPVPKNLFKTMDICIGSFGSATVAAQGGALSIRLLADTGIAPKGLIGYDIFYPYVSSKYEEHSLDYYLERILYGDKFAGCEFVPPPEIEDWIEKHNLENEIMRPYEHIQDSYYDVCSIKSQSLRDCVEKLLIRVIGPKSTIRIEQRLRKAYNKKRK